MMNITMDWLFRKPTDYNADALYKYTAYALKSRLLWTLESWIEQWTRAIYFEVLRYQCS